MGLKLDRWKGWRESGLLFLAGTEELWWRPAMGAGSHVLFGVARVAMITCARCSLLSVGRGMLISIGIQCE
ncbi:uncharacterized protein BP01DRAFT_82176 [Aspergillus saccharolyticus JOP 1030-1]|uniref:Uncharacterized protein n=1 Tax=Aspergillus saccharolyticus JOP 1030-1 TaxID=1450539 RepID=A0A318ZAT2_9EURO|nr:hypothetical protein BP01DRAFT_82176 [Aspergillus saccharolyticus JOP 1030-1]PYH44399.1 hypothetical protein BP01DRAFT_82176 [Aspergillus saccharolyticus JOP 1030-1]